MKPLATYLCAGLACLVSVFHPQPTVAASPRPKLQIINGSAQTVDVFWLKSDTERVPNGSVASGQGHDHHDDHRPSLRRRRPRRQDRAHRDQRGAGAGRSFRSAGQGRRAGVLHAARQRGRLSHRRVGQGESLRAQGSRVSRGPDARQATGRARGDDQERRAALHPRVERVHHRPAGVGMAGERAGARVRGHLRQGLSGRPRPRHGRQRDRSVLLLRRGKPARLSRRSVLDGEHSDPRVRAQHPPARHGRTWTRPSTRASRRPTTAR